MAEGERWMSDDCEAIGAELIWLILSNLSHPHPPSAIRNPALRLWPFGRTLVYLNACPSPCARRRTVPDPLATWVPGLMFSDAPSKERATPSSLNSRTLPGSRCSN